MDGSLFHSRFARRLLLLFVGCALVPVGILAGLALTHTTAQLEDQTRERLHQASKSLGLSILERLALLESEARLLADADGPVGDAAERFEAVAVVGPDGSLRPVVGTPPVPPPLEADQRAHLARGGTVLVAREADDARADRLLLTIPWGDPGSGARVVAALDVDYVVLPAVVHTEGDGPEFCIVAEGSGPLACSVDPVPAALADATGRSTSGQLEWSRDGERYLAHHWSLFLKGRYAAPSWTVVLAEPRGMVLGPLEDFKRFLVLVAAGSMCCVLLLSIGQIRRSLVPLQRLRIGTRRIARREFDARVTVESRDEFQEVADSFNAMAETLGRQFTALITIDEIDRAVLSTVESDEIVETVLCRVGDVQPCDAAGFVLLDDEDGRAGDLRLAVGGRETRHPVQLTPAEVEALRSRGDVATLVAGPGGPAWLDPFAQAGMDCVQALPVVVGERLRGILALGHHGEPRAGDTAAEYARQIADQVAVGLANADMIAEIRELNRTLEDKVRARTAELSAALEELRETQARLVHREKMASVGQLVAGVAHEINNPLNFLHGNLPFLKRYGDTLLKAIAEYEGALQNPPDDASGLVAEVRERHDLEFLAEDLDSTLDACREGVERTTAIVADLQSFSRLDGGDVRESDLHEGLDKTLSILSNRLADVEVVKEYGEIPPVECMTGQVDQVFMNLVVNAADAIAARSGGEGGGRIVLRTGLRDDATVRVEVEDDGCGIEPDHLQRIFDPFFTTKEVGQGTGLGLAISFGVISRHGGSIHVESEPGRGSRFSVDLPVKWSSGSSDLPEGASQPERTEPS